MSDGWITNLNSKAYELQDFKAADDPEVAERGLSKGQEIIHDLEQRIEALEVLEAAVQHWGEDLPAQFFRYLEEQDND